jgi:carboxyl-terminal processing protease
MNDPYLSEPNLPRRRPFPMWFLLLAVFFAGALLDRYGLLPGRYGHEPPGLARTFTPYWEAWHLVEEHYVDRTAIDPERMMQGSIHGMLASLGDTGHTSYLTREDVQRLRSGLEGHLEGIGARLSVRKGRPTIIQTMPNSPARAAGLRPGDVLVAVDGQAVEGMSLDQVVDKVRGPAGTTVRLRVLREEEARPLDIAATRARINVPDVTWHMLPGAPVAHVALREFGKNADEQLRTALQEARAKGARALALDVRGNPGGLKDQAVDVTSAFLQPGEVVFIERDSFGRETKVPAVQEGSHAPAVPVCVLIDEGTASSAEIFAGALQDYGRGQLVGTRTFGTGTVLEPFPLSDGSAVLLAVAEWLTPKGRQIWHHGIEPDVEVPLPSGASILMPESEDDLTAAGLAKSSDKQLLKAFELLKEQIGRSRAKGHGRQVPAPPAPQEKGRAEQEHAEAPADVKVI